MKSALRSFFNSIELLAVVLFLGGVRSSQAQNLLADPGFESGVFSPNSWSAVNAAAFSHDYSHGGVWSLKDAYDSNGIGPVVGGTQVVPGFPGLTYSLSAWALIPAALNGGQGLLLIDFQDSNHQLINYNGAVFYTVGALTTSPTQTWNFLSGSVTAVPGTAYVQVIAELFNLGSPSPNNVVYFDDVSLTQVPEPAGLALICLGVGAFAHGLRRRELLRKGG